MIKMDMNLTDFGRFLKKEKEECKIRKDMASHLVLCLIGYLNNENDMNDFVPRQIQILEELYSFTEYEIQYEFRRYKRKTWRRLNEILMSYDLPHLRLPQGYTTDL